MYLTVIFNDMFDFNKNGEIDAGTNEQLTITDNIANDVFMGYDDIHNQFYSSSNIIKNVGWDADTDGDGWPDAYEIEFGTNPNSDGDCPRTSLRVDAGSVVLRFPVDDRGWRIERSADLGAWTDAGGAPLVPDPGYTEGSGDPGWREESFTGEAGFFRIRRRDR